jgi:pyridoxine/pyridoxamine 5'-phosphate oxidase
MTAGGWRQGLADPTWRAIDRPAARICLQHDANNTGLIAFTTKFSPQPTEVLSVDRAITLHAPWHCVSQARDRGL